MIRIGHGYDVHKLVEGRRLVLGGVEIPYEKGLLGHSDADVLAHAVADALLRGGRNEAKTEKEMVKYYKNGVYLIRNKLKKI